MKKYLALFIFFVLPSVSFAAHLPDVEKAMIARGMEGQVAIFARDYDKAMGIFTALEKEYPGHPIGYFGQMAVYEMRMLERENFFLGKEFEAVAKKGRRAVVKTRSRQPTDWDLLVCGSLLGLEGFYKARGEHWWDAYVLGVKSRQTFKTIVKRNPNFADAYFGMGMYLYWRSVYRNKISFLRIFPDKRAEGIAIVELVARNGHFAKDLAEVNLGMVWLEEKDYDRAHRIFKKFSDRYPNNVLLYLFDGRSLIAGKRYDEAAKTFKRLQGVDPSIVQAYYFIGVARVLQKQPEHYGEAEKELLAFVGKTGSNRWKAAGYYWLGRLEEARGNKAKAKGYYEEGLKYNPKLKKLKLKIRGLGSGF